MGAPGIPHPASTAASADADRANTHLSVQFIALSVYSETGADISGNRTAAQPCGFKVQVQQRIIQTSQEMVKRSHEKDGKQRAFSTFPRHCYGYLFESVHEFCCTWTLNVPTPPTVVVGLQVG
jgi:hypothetical protein